MARWMDAPTFRERYYTGRKPDLRTIRARIRAGRLPGVRQGRLYYVDLDALEDHEPDVDRLVQRVLDRG